MIASWGGGAVRPCVHTQMIPLEDHPNSNIKVPLYQLLQAPAVLLSVPPIPAEAQRQLSGAIMHLHYGRRHYTEQS